MSHESFLSSSVADFHNFFYTPRSHPGAIRRFRGFLRISDISGLHCSIDFPAIPDDLADRPSQIDIMRQGRDT